MSGQYEELAALKRRVWELERRVGLSRPAGPQPAELGEVTDDSPFVVTLTDGMEISPSTTFGGTAVVGDPALVVYPRDGDPVAVLKAAAVSLPVQGLYLRTGTATWSAASGAVSEYFATGQGVVSISAPWASVVSGAVVLDPGLYITQWHLGWSTGSVTGIIESQIGFSFASTTITSSTVFGKNSGTTLSFGDGALSIYVSNRTTGTISNPSYALGIMRIGDEP